VTKGLKKHKAILPLESPRETLCNKSPIAYKVLRKKKFSQRGPKGFQKQSPQRFTNKNPKHQLLLQVKAIPNFP